MASGEEWANVGGLVAEAVVDGGVIREKATSCRRTGNAALPTTGSGEAGQGVPIATTAQRKRTNRNCTHSALAAKLARTVNPDVLSHALALLGQVHILLQLHG